MNETDRKEDKYNTKGYTGTEATTQAQTPLEDFESNKDHLMRSVEEDLDVLAWICWGLELYFEDLSYEDMKKYMMNHPDYEDIKKHIITVPPRVKDIDNPGIEFDLMNIIEQMIEGELDIKGLDIENEGAYSQKRIKNRRIIYLSAGLFYLEREYTGNHYDKIPTMVSLWIFPRPGSEDRKNGVLTHRYLDKITEEAYSLNYYKNKDNKKENKEEDSKNEDSKDKNNSEEPNLKAYDFFLSNPEEVLQFFAFEEENKTKKGYLLLLLDCLFNYEASVSRKLEILDEYFNLKSNKVQKEVEAMTQLMRDFDDYTGGIVSKSERLEEENGELKEKYGTLEEKYETLEERNETLETEDKIKTEKIETLETEDKIKTEKIETLEDQKHESMLRLIAFLLQSGYSESEAQAEAKKIFG